VVGYVHARAALDERGHPPARPMRQTGIRGWTGPARRQNPSPNRCRDLLPPSPTRPIQQTRNPLGVIAGQPQIHGRPRHLRERGDLLLLPPLRPPQYNSRPRRHRRRHIRVVYQRSQLCPFIRRQLHPSIKHENDADVKVTD